MRWQSGHPPKKLERLAREWAGGRSLQSDDDEFDEECRKFGVDPAELRWSTDAPAKERPVIWPDMRDSVAFFFAMSTQWHWASAGMAGVFRTGLRYEALEPVARATEITMTPVLFDDIRTLEREALGVWSRRRG